MPDTSLNNWPYASSNTTAVTHVAVGLSVALPADLERLLPARSVPVVDEPDTVRARRGRERIIGFTCVAGLVEAPTQDEAGAERPAALIRWPQRLRVLVPARVLPHHREERPVRRRPGGAGARGNLGFSAQGIAGPVLFTGVVIALGGWGRLALGGVFALAGAPARPVAGRLAAVRARTHIESSLAEQ
ncbi:hypothetical protein [Streptomyces sp. NPDC048606]|uniref:hypothetical protein n=1 Tax=Streptomyces sp. NPDC048606 TaxID=3154726 RepID=UPI0034324B28